MITNLHCFRLLAWHLLTSRCKFERSMKFFLLYRSVTLRLLALALVVWTVSACADKAELEAVEAAEEVARLEQARQDSLELRQEQQRRKADSLRNRFPAIKYTPFVVSSQADRALIGRTYRKTTENWTAYRAFTTVNRKDIQFVRIGDTLLIPDTLMEDLRAYSVFPQYYAAADTITKLIMVSNAMQCYACYENGELVRFAAANTGEERKPTLPGRYAVNWKDRKRLSSLDSTWVLPFTVNFHLYAGSALHQFEMPGRPVSHSCVRQFLSDADWLFHWVQQGKVNKEERRIIPMTGTPLIIIDVFDFSRKKGGPWLELEGNRDIELELPDDPMNVEEALIPISQIPKVVRGGLPDKTRYETAEEVIRERGWIRPNVKLRESIDFNKLRRDRKAREVREAKEKAAKKAADSVKALQTAPSES